ncbi:MAG: HlyD family efflux transporter periplasmic adaptor subunit [Clostridiales bacterium]|jgi:multidrug efflux pump subunit AcrA (membrane-fusion protein)|nr:HlyD family efflux transporter periplasmic adaptor subunit [Eubacteriales bacterium]MDH7564920.1 HlyD family efflux transporter periplasmic adaptor subunit [Clostridiales bacterium]
MKKKIIIGSVVAVLVIVIIAANILKGGGAVSVFASGPVHNVTVKKIERGDITSTISASGVIEEMEKAEIYFDTPLKVKELLVEKNQKVVKGQKLVELDMDSLQSELEQLKISRNVQVLSAKTASTQSDVIQAENAVKSAERAYEDSKKKYEDSKTLFATNAISKSELDAAEKAMTDAQMALDNAKASYQDVVTSKSVNVDTQNLNLKATDLKIADLEKKIQNIREGMVSPIDGVVAEVNLTRGGYTSNVQSAFKIVNPEKLQVRADVKEFDIKHVAVGQSVSITGDAISKEDGIVGKVQSISSVAKKNKTTSGDETLIEVVVSVDKSNPVLKPGLSVTCDITTSEKKNVLLADFQMLKDDKDGNKMVYVAEGKDNAMVMRERRVKLGISSELNAEVLEGLKEGDTVILDPQPSFKDGARIKISKNEEK